jgi:hypothetical protein
MRVSGSITRQMERVDLSMQIEMCTQAIGLMIRLMGMVSIFIQMVPDMKENGTLISNKEKEKRAGLMEQYLRVNTWKARNTVKGTSSGLMEATTAESSRITTFMEQDTTGGLMAEHTMASGNSTRCMGMEYLHGMMADNMKENTTMIRNKEEAHSHGLMVEYTLVDG